MRSRHLFLASLFVSLTLGAAAACSSSVRDGGFDQEDGGGTADDSGSVIPTADTGPGISSGGSSGGRPQGVPEVFVQSSDTLYKLDPTSKALTEVAAFGGVEGNIVDIALDADGQMYGCTTDALYKIDKATGAAEKIGNGGKGKYPNSLSFVPAGTVDPNREVLVGYLGADYINIDPETGNTKVIRANALGDQLISSGDIVSIKEGDFLTYLTVKPADLDDCTSTECKACKTNDCLFQVDPATGEMISNLGTTNRPKVFGLAFWAGTVYGINSDGKLFEIDPDASPLATGVKNITIPGSVSSEPIQFYGAGSSTSAPKGPN